MNQVSFLVKEYAIMTFSGFLQAFEVNILKILSNRPQLLPPKVPSTTIITATSRT
jgi:hypothetical protein